MWVVFILSLLFITVLEILAVILIYGDHFIFGAIFMIMGFIALFTDESILDRALKNVQKMGGDK